MKNKNILVFEIKAREAHFKQPASNSTSLTFPVPPRTTIIGLLGAITGYENYSDIFSPENCDISIEINSLNMTFLEDLNYVGTNYKVKNIPFEYICEQNGGMLSYLIYITHKEDNILEDLKDRIINNRYYHGVPKLGKTECFAILNFIDMITDFEEMKKDDVIINTVIKANNILCFDMNRDYEEDRRIEAFTMPRILNKERYLESAENYIVPTNMKGIYVKEINDSYITLKLNDEIKNISWM